MAVVMVGTTKEQWIRVIAVAGDREQDWWFNIELMRISRGRGGPGRHHTTYPLDRARHSTVRSKLWK